MCVSSKFVFQGAQFHWKIMYQMYLIDIIINYMPIENFKACITYDNCL